MFLLNKVRQIYIKKTLCLHMQVTECISFRMIFNKHGHYMDRMNVEYRITMLALQVLLVALMWFDPTSATSDVNITKFEVIDSQVLSELPKIQCQERNVPSGRAMESCIFKSDFKKIFIIGFNATTCYLCYVNSSFSKLNLREIQNVNWYTSPGK